MGDMGSFEENVEKLKQLVAARDTALVAEVYSWAGQADLAFEWIDKAIDAGETVHWNLFLPIWENLRSDPRWDELRVRLDWTDEQLSMLDFSFVLRNPS